MYKKIASVDKLRKIASIFIKFSQEQNSPYINIPYYEQRTNPSLTKTDVMPGPPSMYNDLGKEDRLKNKEDIRRQGPRPTPVDILHKDRPVTDTKFFSEPPKTDVQGEPSDNTTEKGRNEDRITVPFDPGSMDVENYEDYYA